VWTPQDDPEARIRELERPLGDAAGMSELGAAKLRTTAGTRGWATALADAFQNGVDEDTVTQCPNGNQSPGTWATDAAPNVSAGSVLCGNYDNRPDLMWTNNHDLLLSDIQGPDLNALY
jgi:hypothetical protein